VLVARQEIQTPFAVINADDYYGSRSFAVLGESLADMRSDSMTYVMVGFDLEKTLSEHGEVARGVCTISNGRLVSIIEREKIRRSGGEIVCQVSDGAVVTLDRGAQVSMNCWGFAPETFFPRVETEFRGFLSQRSADVKAEFYLPSIINNGLADGRITVNVLQSGEQWFGMTYPQDRERVRQCIEGKIREGVYPEKL
ncbi:MAG: hypothetical protein JXA71_02920, partial [Chitinispirillaceae bacterium]|nr:hypothetical protein [Chitinispirillaceae bacterium]